MSLGEILRKHTASQSDQRFKFLLHVEKCLAQFMFWLVGHGETFSVRPKHPKPTDTNKRQLHRNGESRIQLVKEGLV